MKPLKTVDTYALPKGPEALKSLELKESRDMAHTMIEQFALLEGLPIGLPEYRELRKIRRSLRKVKESVDQYVQKKIQIVGRQKPKKRKKRG